MKIGIVAPSPVPFTIGGAENLWQGLLGHLNTLQDVQAELIKLPSPERTFGEVVSSYRQFSELDVTHLDTVITGKYPAWMVWHPNHIVYMLHRLRGLYDSWQARWETPGLGDARLAPLRKLLEHQEATRAMLPTLFGEVERLTANPDSPREWFAFPGGLIRRIVHKLDAIALAPTEIRKYNAISSRVATREGYFPSGAHVTVAICPSGVSVAASRMEVANSTPRGDPTFFTASRLDSPKRLDLVVSAFRKVAGRAVLHIAGDGPERERLETLASGDPRIRFLGRLTDSELLSCYMGAYAVPFVPFDEDLGLVTIEAFAAGKPVITARDGGGSKELVRDGYNGLIVDPTPEALAAAFESLLADPPLVARMGVCAKSTAAAIQWQAVCEGILGTVAAPTPDRSSRLPAPKPRMVVTTTFSIYPPRGGGQCRIYGLFSALARWWEIEIVSLAPAADAPLRSEIAPGLVECRVPKSTAHECAENELSAQVGNKPVTDIAAALHWAKTPAYVAALRSAAEDASVIVASHPYLYPAIALVAPHVPLVFEAQDVEIDLKHAILSGAAEAEPLLDATRQVEAMCWKSADLTVACSSNDNRRLEQLYGAPGGHVEEVPNGYDAATLVRVTAQSRQEARRRIGTDSTIALFIGSWHGPNIEAVQSLLRAAHSMPHTQFLIAGSVGGAFKGHALPPNVGMLGSYDDDTRDTLLNLADVALNPMSSGSGTNLKMIEYLAAGLITVSTEFGARGLPVTPGVHYVSATEDGFADGIRRALTMPAAERERMETIAAELMREHFGWDRIAGSFNDALQALVARIGTGTDKSAAAHEPAER